MKTKTTLPIVAVNFSFSMKFFVDGSVTEELWVKKEKRLTSDGIKQTTEWISSEQLLAEVGKAEFMRLYRNEERRHNSRLML